MPDIEIGSSDAPVILGCSPHATPYQLWLERVGVIERKDEPTDVMQWGSALERAVLDKVTRDMGLGPYLYQATARSYERPWQRSTPDAVILNEYGSPHILIEVKGVVGHPPSVPRVDWIVQTLHHWLVREEASEVYIVSFGALRHEVWRIPYHHRAMMRVLREEEAFLGRIEREDPPPVSGRDASILNRAWPLLSEEMIRLGQDAVSLDCLLVEAKAQIKAWQEIEKDAESRLKDQIGPHTKATLPNGATYFWRESKREGHVVGPHTTRPLTRREA